MNVRGGGRKFRAWTHQKEEVQDGERARQREKGREETSAAAKVSYC